MRKIITLMALMCLLLVFQSVFAQTYDSPKPNNVPYDGTVHYLLIAGNTRGNESLHFWYENPSTNEWSENPENIPGGKYPGKYTVRWTMINGDQNPNQIPENELHYNEETVTISLNETDTPDPKQDLIYKANDKQFLVDTKDAKCENEVCRLPIYDDIYYFRLCPSTTSCPSVQWDAMIPSASGVRAYRIEYIIGSPEETPESDIANGYIWAEIKYQASDSSQIPTIDPDDTETPTPETPTPETPTPETPTPETVTPEPHPVRPSHNGPFYRIGDGSDLFTEDLSLPATGFPTHFNIPLAIQPENISYESLAMRIQIPVINVDVELTGVPEVDSTWAVEWLADRAGLLSRSAMPGEGHAMIAAHNHLNAEEIGPFALLFSLEENDRIFINTPEGGLQIYSVYANELLEPDDVKAMAAIAQKETNSLILVTCENEMVDGGYMNRRAIFAKPVASL